MISPLYIAEQKAFFPNRVVCNSFEEVKKHFSYLIENNITTIEEMRKVPIKNLQRDYFGKCDSSYILDAFRLYK